MGKMERDRWMEGRREGETERQRRRECEKERFMEGKRKRDIGNNDRQREEGRGR